MGRQRARQCTESIDLLWMIWSIPARAWPSRQFVFTHWTGTPSYLWCSKSSTPWYEQRCLKKRYHHHCVTLYKLTLLTAEEMIKHCGGEFSTTSTKKHTHTHTPEVVICNFTCGLSSGSVTRKWNLDECLLIYSGQEHNLRHWRRSSFVNRKLMRFSIRVIYCLMTCFSFKSVSTRPM